MLLVVVLAMQNAAITSTVIANRSVSRQLMGSRCLKPAAPRGSGFSDDTTFRNAIDYSSGLDSAYLAHPSTGYTYFAVWIILFSIDGGGVRGICNVQLSLRHPRH